MAGNRSWVAEYLLLRSEGIDPEENAREAMREALECISSMPETFLPEDVERTHLAVMQAIDAGHALVVHYATELRDRGWTRAEVADAVDSSPNQVSRWEDAIANDESVDAGERRMTRRDREAMVEEAAAIAAEQLMLEEPQSSGLPRRWELPI